MSAPCTRHFLERCRERGLPLDAARLKAAIERLRPCWHVEGCTVYRFLVQLRGRRRDGVIVVWNDARKVLVTAVRAGHGHPPHPCAGGGVTPAATAGNDCGAPEAPRSL